MKRFSLCIKSFVLVAMFVASASWCHAEQSPSANELVVEASQLIQSAASALTPEQAVSLLEEAHRKLVLITEVHPSSDLAVKLATGQGIGTVSLAGVQAAITEKCWDSLSLLCVARLTLDTLLAEERSGRDHVLFVVASAQMKAGAAEAAQATWGIAIKAALSEEDHYIQDMYLQEIARAQAEAGQFGTALKTAGLIDKVEERARALLSIAAAQRKVGKAEDAQIIMDKVLASAASIDDADDRAYVLAQVAEAQAEAGQFGTAIKTAELIENVRKRLLVLLNVATAQAEAGQFDIAVKTAASIADAERRANVLLVVAAGQTKAGNVEDARTTAKRAADVAQSIQDPSDRAQTLNAVAVSYINMGEKESARGTIGLAIEATQAVTDVTARLVPLLEIAAAQTKMGDAESARGTMDTAIKHFKAAQKDYFLLQTFLSNGIKRVPLEADQLAEVIAIIKSPEVETVYSDALVSLARYLAEEGTVSNVMEVLKQAGGYDKTIFLIYLISSQVRATQFAEAIKTAQRIEGPKSRVGPLAEIALAQAKNGQVEAARATIGLATEAVKLSGWNVYPSSLIDLVKVKVEVGLVGDAKHLLRDLLRNTRSAITAGHETGAPPSTTLYGTLLALMNLHDAALL